MRSVRDFSFKNHCKVFVINKLYLNLKLKCVIWVKRYKMGYSKWEAAFQM